MANKTLKLNKEEREILDAVEKDTLVSVPMSSKEIMDIKQIARNTFAKTRSVNIRISERDLLHLKAKAMRAGMPYQTYIVSKLHKEAMDA